MHNFISITLQDLLISLHPAKLQGLCILRNSNDSKAYEMLKLSSFFLSILETPLKINHSPTLPISCSCSSNSLLASLPFCTPPVEQQHKHSPLKLARAVRSDWSLFCRQTSCLAKTVVFTTEHYYVLHRSMLGIWWVQQFDIFVPQRHREQILCITPRLQTGQCRWCCEVHTTEF
jgi:hypothetical protein